MSEGPRQVETLFWSDDFARAEGGQIGPDWRMPTGQPFTFQAPGPTRYAFSTTTVQVVSPEGVAFALRPSRCRHPRR